VTYADIHAEALAGAGWGYGFTAYVNGNGWKMIVADAHKDGVRLIVHAECPRNRDARIEVGSATHGSRERAPERAREEPPRAINSADR
jgi:hypothetical protein